jgi:hypothetical protein
MVCLGESQSFTIGKKEPVFVASVGSHGAQNNQNHLQFRITYPSGYPMIIFIMIHMVLDGFNLNDCDCELSWRGERDVNNAKQEPARNFYFPTDYFYPFRTYPKKVTVPSSHKISGDLSEILLYIFSTSLTHELPTILHSMY